MAVKTGLLTTFDIAENKVDVSPVLSMLNLPETPLLNKIGIAAQAVNSTRYEWWDDVLPVFNTTLSAAYLTGGGSLTVASVAGILPGAVIKVESSLYRVTAVDSGTNTLTISVLENDADHSSGVTVEIIAVSGKEAEEYADMDYTQKVKRYNMTQIFRDYVKFSGTQLSVQQYVNEDVFADEVRRKLQRIKIWMEKAIVNGVRLEPSDNTTPRLLGGLRWFINQKGLTTSASFSEANLKAFLKQIVDAGGVVKEAWMNPSTMTNFLDLESSKLVIDKGDQTVGRKVKQYLSEYGDLTLYTDPHIPANEIIIVDTSKLAVKPLKGRAAFYEELAKTGDYVKGQLIGEYTLEFRNPDAAGIFTIV
ncbi:SU10 major capsid protein [Kosmotoga pacifica]|uniref:Phage protein n=1 Tax=Kosmotoga pacifica TaxID=1330330 RepID=A0A0G2ZAH3_9BACT|nr:DUF5309 family protein [Kosmotoga pacifica]AKI96579.1 hypothetical protein IX53_00695 [Kosmotoga pacifica]